MLRALIPVIAGIAGLIAIACSSGGETGTVVPTPAGTARAAKSSPVSPGVAVAGPTIAPTGISEPVDPRDERYGGVLRVAQPGDPISCDLAMSRGVGYQSVHPCNPMLSQIVRASADDHAVILPDLATEYSLSPDGRTWTFKLREDARWHDGAPVTADDLKFSLDRVIDPPEGLLVGRAGPIKSYISSTDQIKTPDEHTLTITTDFPAASFITNLASVYVSAFPRAATEKLDPPSMVLHNQVVGSGPFKFDSATRGSFYRMIRNNDYYEPDLPFLDGITYLVMPSPAIRLAALKAGEVEIIMLLTEAEAESLEGDSRIRLIREPSAGGNTVQMNLSVPPFDDPRVRRAVNLAFDRSEAVIALGGGFNGAIMPPGGPWALDLEEVSQLPGYGDAEAERAEARQLLADAGFPDGFNVKMQTRSDPFSTSLAEFAAAQLATVGIMVELEPMERTAYQDFLLRGKHALISHSHSFSLDDPDAILPAHYSCGGSENFPGFCDPELDEMIQAQSRELDPGKRKELVDEIQRRVWEADAKIWFNWSVRRTPVSVRVQNFAPGGPSLYQGRRLESVWLAD